MEYAEENDIPGLFLLIDFEKAFDSISWNFLNNILKIFNFGNLLKNGLKRFRENFLILFAIIPDPILYTVFNNEIGRQLFRKVLICLPLVNM
jgi:hypothetical protein